MVLSLALACVDPGPPAQAGTQVHERIFVDPSRATPEILELAASDRRQLRTVVWVGPATSDEAPERPLLIMAHGDDGAPEKFDAFARALAAAGIVVAAPAFPATTHDSGADSLGAADLGEQPADLQFVLDGLLAAVLDPDDALWMRFDPDRVVALGHSLGGATVLGWTRFDRSPTLLGTGFLSPAAPLTVIWGPSIDPSGPPTLLAHGIDDPLIGYPVSTGLYDQLDDPVWLLGITGATHSDPIEDQSDPPLPTRLAMQTATIAFVRSLVLDQPAVMDGALAALYREGHEVGW